MVFLTQSLYVSPATAPLVLPAMPSPADAARRSACRHGPQRAQPLETRPSSDTRQTGPVRRHTAGGTSRMVGEDEGDREVEAGESGAAHPVRSAACHDRGRGSQRACTSCGVPPPYASPRSQREGGLTSTRLVRPWLVLPSPWPSFQPMACIILFPIPPTGRAGAEAALAAAAAPAGGPGGRRGWRGGWLGSPYLLRRSAARSRYCPPPAPASDRRCSSRFLRLQVGLLEVLVELLSTGERPLTEQAGQLVEVDQRGVQFRVLFVSALTAVRRHQTRLQTDTETDRESSYTHGCQMGTETDRETGSRQIRTVAIWAVVRYARLPDGQSSDKHGCQMGSRQISTVARWAHRRIGREFFLQRSVVRTNKPPNSRTDYRTDGTKKKTQYN